MPDIPATPQTSAIANAASGAVDAAAGTATSAAAAAPAPAPAPAPPPDPAPAPPDPAPAPVPAPKAAAPVADTVTHAAAPAPKPAQVVDTVAHATTAPAVKSVTDQATATVSNAIAPHAASTVNLSSAKSVADTAAGAVDGATAAAAAPSGAVTQATDPVVKGTVETVTQATDPVVHTTTTVTQTAESAVHTTTTTVTQAAEPAVQATSTTVAHATDPVVAATGGAGSAVKQTVDTVTSTAGQAAGPVRPVVDTVTSTTSGAPRTVDAVAASGPVAPGPTAARIADAIPGAPVSQATRAVNETLGSAAAGVRPSVTDIAAGTGVRPSVTDLASHGVAAPRTGLVDTLAGTPGADPGILTAPPTPAPATSSLLAHTTPIAQTPAPGGGAVAHSTAADAVAHVATDPRFLVVTGVTALAGTAYVAARGASSVAGGDPGIILNNVRLIPCLVKSGMTSGATALAGLGSGARQVAGSTSTTVRAGIYGVNHRASKVAEAARKDLAEHVVDPFREGVARATGNGAGSGGSGSDLFFLGIGLVVGLLYAAILTLWLFLARPRWSTRA